eukprot:TRINITY_DN42415_c0_g1_i1.p1 TRINITY_DN42415_c0_g1~~TRINITY_DN42415_c0_g1_i1.p1  ORF type:complete len:422 (-),score=94.32 TRINITY_DN42415_c0_g1_i1:165-1430(-)
MMRRRTKKTKEQLLTGREADVLYGELGKTVETAFGQQASARMRSQPAPSFGFWRSQNLGPVLPRSRPASARAKPKAWRPPKQSEKDPVGPGAYDVASSYTHELDRSVQVVPGFGSRPRFVGDRPVPVRRKPRFERKNDDDSSSASGSPRTRSGSPRLPRSADCRSSPTSPAVGQPSPIGRRNSEGSSPGSPVSPPLSPGAMSRNSIDMILRARANSVMPSGSPSAVQATSGSRPSIVELMASMGGGHSVERESTLKEILDRKSSAVNAFAHFISKASSEDLSGKLEAVPPSEAEPKSKPKAKKKAKPPDTRLDSSRGWPRLPEKPWPQGRLGEQSCKQTPAFTFGQRRTTGRRCRYEDWRDQHAEAAVIARAADDEEATKQSSVQEGWQMHFFEKVGWAPEYAWADNLLLERAGLTEDDHY